MYDMGEKENYKKQEIVLRVGGLSSMKSNSDRIKIVVKAFLATWACSRVVGMPATNLLTVFAFAFFLYIFARITERKRIEGEKSLQQRIEKILSVIFMILYLCGGFEKICSGLDNILFRSVILLVTGFGLYIIFEMAISIIVIETSKWEATGSVWKQWLIPSLSGVICFICWLPYLWKNYPGVMTIDSMNQFAQVIGVYADSNHHPWVHTQIIKLWYQVGLLFTDDMSVAISFYTVFQMIFMASCVAYLVATLKTFQVKKWILALVVAFYACIPYHAIYAVTIWKDSLFAGGVLLYVATLLRLLQWLNQRNWKSSEEHISAAEAIRDRKKVNWAEMPHIRDMIMLVLSGIMMCLFRTNGWYAFLVTIPFVLFVFWKYWKVIGALQFIVMAVVMIVKGPVMDANHVIQPDLVESLSIPVQQISRVIVKEKPITKEQSAFLNNILDTSKIQDLYNPYVSDGFKRLVRAGDETYMEEHLGEFLKVYAQIGLQYPVDYLIAFRDQSIGYWFPTQEGIIAGDEGVIPNEFGVSNRPVLSGKIVIKINEIGLKLKDIIPGYGILWSMGAMFWLIILMMGITLIRGDNNMLLLYVPCIAIFLTIVIATPVAKEFRYAYAYIYCMPIYLLVPFIGNNKSNVKNTK